MQRADSLEKTLMLGKIEGKRRRGLNRMNCLDSITDKLQERVEDWGTWRAIVHEVTNSQT